jgi:hypothetical protein
MPDLALPALDVAIGLAALFFLLSMVCSAVNEGIANVLAWRAKTLEDALVRLVGDDESRRKALGVGQRLLGRVEPKAQTPPAAPPGHVDGGARVPVAPAVYDHWRIRTLVRDPDSSARRRARPSYLPPRAFSLALAEVLAKPPERDATKPSAWEQTDAELFGRLKEGVESLPPGQLRDFAAKALSNAGNTVEGFREQVEHTFDDAMERASGWYKRKIQVALAVIAAIVALGMNVDTVRVTNSLWSDAPLRTAVAERAAATGTPASAAEAVEGIDELGLPVGWGPNTPEGWGWLAAVPGWLVTIAAVSLGAPFWFDLLSRFARLRGSGVPERPRSLDDTAGTVGAERKERRERARERSKPEPDESSPPHPGGGTLTA